MAAAAAVDKAFVTGTYPVPVPLFGSAEVVCRAAVGSPATLRRVNGPAPSACVVADAAAADGMAVVFWMIPRGMETSCTSTNFNSNQMRYQLKLLLLMATV